jgi:hypothetical protein
LNGVLIWLVSTLKEFVKALGVIASFPDASYHIKQFESDDAADDAALA